MLAIIFQSSTIWSLKRYKFLMIQILSRLKLRNPAVPYHYLLLLIRNQFLLDFHLLFPPIPYYLNPGFYIRLYYGCRF